MKSRVTYLIILLIVFLSQRCVDTNKDILFQVVAPSYSGIDFVNQVSHLPDFTILDYMYFYNGGGVAIGDINNDGLEDIFFTGNQVSSKLYLNRGGLEFEDITESAGLNTSVWCSGVTMEDVNQDGWLDIYVCVTASRNSESRKNLLFINNQDNTFSEKAELYGVSSSAYSTQSAFLDFDLDGDLDLFVLNHMQQFKGTNNPLPKKVHGQSPSTDQLFRKDMDEQGNIQFIDVSQEAGIKIEGFGLGVGVSDLNRDGWPDIYISNDFVSNDLLYLNKRDNTFRNRIGRATKHQSHNGMGNDIADFNNDGWSDIFVADMLPATNERRKMMVMNQNYDRFHLTVGMGYEPQYPRNTLQLNNGTVIDDGEALSIFSEIGQLANVYATDWSWASLFADFDNDGWKDLFITNGHLKDLTNKDFISYRKNRMLFNTPQGNDSLYLSLLEELPAIQVPNYFFKNNRDLTFEDKSDQWIKKQSGLSNGAAVGDLDNDGDLDLVVNNLNAPAQVFENTSTFQENRFIQFELIDETTNLNAIGAKVEIYHEGAYQYQELYPTRGYLSSVSRRMHFGLDNVPKVDSVIITWPDQQVQYLYDVPGNRMITIQKEGIIQKKRIDGLKLIFENVAVLFGMDFHHKENDYVDFKVERLLPHQYSINGPGIAVGDVNGDGKEDLYIGGAAGQPGAMYIQKDGQLIRNDFEEDKDYEDMGCLFFDADQDGDKDLYVVSGGGQYWSEPEMFQDRLYINETGTLHHRVDLLPAIHTSGSRVVNLDIDDDGDQDLLVGGRLTPGTYPMPPRSYVLQNVNGKFLDATDSLAPKLKNVGMVTDALLSDYDNDGHQDLIVIGEWMSITFFKKTENRFEQDTPIVRNESGEVIHTSGWWNRIIAGDFDNDKDKDYLLGNLGLNSALKASQEYPVTIKFGHIDQNNSWDAILAHYLPDEQGALHLYPLPSRDLMIDQMNTLQKKYLDYQSYSKATIDEITSYYPDPKVSKLEAHEFRSCMLINEGGGQFTLKPLPKICQISPIYGMVACDINRDSILDLVVGGNFRGPSVEIGAYDASYGQVLLGRGDGTFDVQGAEVLGNSLEGEVREIIPFHVNEELHYIVVRNNGPVSILRKRNNDKKSR